MFSFINTQGVPWKGLTKLFNLALIQIKLHKHNLKKKKKKKFPELHTQKHMAPLCQVNKMVSNWHLMFMVTCLGFLAAHIRHQK